MLNVLGFFGLQTLAIDHLPSGYASLLLYLQPVLTVLVCAGVLLVNASAVPQAGAGTSDEVEVPTPSQR